MGIVAGAGCTLPPRKIKIKIKIKTKIKGDGQECPSYTGNGVDARIGLGRTLI